MNKYQMYIVIIKKIGFQVTIMKYNENVPDIPRSGKIWV